MHVRRTLLTLVSISPTALLLASCTDTSAGAWQPPGVVRIEGSDKAQTVSPAYGLVFGAAIERTAHPAAPLKPVEHVTYVLVRPGELLGVDSGGPPLRYARADGDTLSFRPEGKDADANMLLGGRTVALRMTRDRPEDWAWLRAAPAERLAHVRTLAISPHHGEDKDGQLFSEARRGALARLAQANPHVGLMTGDEAVLRLMLELFDPPWLSTEDLALSAEMQDLLAAEPRLHMLVMNGKAPRNLSFLSRLRHLRTLVLTNWKAAATAEGEAATTAALPTMPSLRTLIVLDFPQKDLGPVGSQPKLKELAVVYSRKLADVGGLARMPGLRALSLMGCDRVKDLSALSSLKHLRWLVLPPGTTQEQLSRICAQHPDLVILQAAGCEQITDLAPLKRLRRLQVLTLCRMEAPLDPVAELESLRLLGIDLDFPRKGKAHEPSTRAVESRKRRKAIQESLVRIMEANPKLKAVKVSPMCLGSGWILLLAPLLAAAWLAARRRGRRATLRHG